MCNKQRLENPTERGHGWGKVGVGCNGVGGRVR